jgi:hypothetical protein
MNLLDQIMSRMVESSHFMVAIDGNKGVNELFAVSCDPLVKRDRIERSEIRLTGSVASYHAWDHAYPVNTPNVTETP